MKKLSVLTLIIALSFASPVSANEVVVSDAAVDLRPAVSADSQPEQTNTLTASNAAVIVDSTLPGGALSIAASDTTPKGGYSAEPSPSVNTAIIPGSTLTDPSLSTGSTLIAPQAGDRTVVSYSLDDALSASVDTSSSGLYLSSGTDIEGSDIFLSTSQISIQLNNEDKDAAEAQKVADEINALLASGELFKDKEAQASFFAAMDKALIQQAVTELKIKNQADVDKLLDGKNSYEHKLNDGKPVGALLPANLTGLNLDKLSKEAQDYIKKGRVSLAKKDVKVVFKKDDKGKYSMDLDYPKKTEAVVKIIKRD